METIKVKIGIFLECLKVKKTGSVAVNYNSIDVKLGENKKNLHVFFCRRPKNENLIHCFLTLAFLTMSDTRR